MKKALLIVLAIALAVFSCTPSRPVLKTGDIIFFGIPSNYDASGDSMADAIASSTGDGTLNLIHAAIVEVEGDSVWIIDATIRHGVDRHPLDTTLADFTLRDGSLPTFIVKRLKSCFNPAFIDNAKAFCGLPYDVHFLPDNGALYCTELIRESYRLPDGSYLFPERPMNWKDSTWEIPQYWTWLFGQLGEEVPQGVPGTNPQDMSLEPILVTVPVVFP